jgi:hypothetical protein
MSGPKCRSGRLVVGVLDGERVAEAQALHDRQVHLQEVRHERALHDVARVGGAALLGVLEALGEVGGQLVPLREVPDAPGVQALLLEEVPLAGVGQRRRGLAPFARPPTKARQPISSERMSTSPSCAPTPDSSVTAGRPAS